MKRTNRLIAVLAFVLLFYLPENIYGQILVPLDPSEKKQAVLEFLNDHPELVPKLHDLISVMSNVENFYVDEKSKEELINLAMKGMVSGLDPYSNLFIGAETDEILKSLDEEKYIGIGIAIIKLGRDCVITSVFKNSPAQKAGLEPGDVILKINGESIYNLNSYEIRNLTRGKENTIVLLEIKSKRFQKPKVVRLIRANIDYTSVDVADIGKYGYIKINKFSGETPTRIAEALSKFQKKDGLIIDLRDNPGGYVDSVNKIAGLFIGSNKITIEMEGRDYRFADKLWTSTQKEKYPPKVVVLVNNFSASASEILAGVLQHYGVAKVIGVRTFGKAVGQSVLSLANDDEGNIRLLLSLTSFKYFLPDGRNISNTGIVPDVEVEQPEGFRIYEYGTKKDRQLQEALNFLKGKKNRL